MKPRILLPIRTKFIPNLLPEWLREDLSSYLDLKVVIDPDNLSQAEYFSLLKDADGMISTWEIPPIAAQAIQAASRLKIIAHGGGMVRYFLSEETFDLRPDLVITNASNVMARPVAEHTLMMSLFMLRNIFYISSWAKQNLDWANYPQDKNVSLLNKKVGIVGLGQIANEFIELARPFRVKFHVFSMHTSEQEAAARGLIKSSLEEIFSTCDVITISAANTPANRHLVNRDLLRLIRPGAVLVNNSRGALIDEAALIEEMRDGRFQATLDVTDPEPPALNNELRKLPNVHLTPHSAGPTPDQCPWMINEAGNILKAFFEGREVWNVVDRKRFSYMA